MPYASLRCTIVVAGWCAGGTLAGGKSGSGGCCSTGGAPTYCVIAGSYYAADGAVNPNNACQSCQAKRSTTAWSNLPDLDKTSCGAGRLCRVGKCEQACTINGELYAMDDGNPNNPCQQTCQPSLSTTAWSNVPPKHCVTAISAGYSYTCAIADGQAYCWGHSSGVNDSFTSPTAIPVQGLSSGVEAISIARGGGDYTCAIVNGGAYCWGSNDYGQLGNGSSSAIFDPVPVPVLGLSNGVQAISAGISHTCAVVNGAAYCWGYNAHGQLGNGTTIDSLVAVPVEDLPAGVTDIAAGGSGTCAVVNAALYCWGLNEYGELGNGLPTTMTAMFSTVPVPVQTLTNEVQAVSSGASRSCAVMGGGAYCWGGRGDYGGDPSPVPRDYLASGVTAISSDAFHVCVVANGGARCWGVDTFGDLGMSNPASYVSSPAQVQGLTSGAHAIAVGYYHSCAVVDANAWCWGDNRDGELGNNTNVSSWYPVLVQFP